MKSLIIASLIAAQGLTAQTALAADLGGSEDSRAGAFGGVRVRVALDGPRRERLRAGLTLAPTLHSRSLAGESRLRIGEGVELGVSERGPPRLSIGGTPVARLAQGPAGPDGRRAGVSTLGWVAIGAGVLVVSTLVLFQLCADGEVCGSDRDG